MKLTSIGSIGIRRAGRGFLAAAMTLAMLTLISGCGSDAAETAKPSVKEAAAKGNTPAPAIHSSGYEVTRETYTDRAITIHYPRISKMNDAEKQSRLNQIIKAEALSILQDYSKVELEKLTVKLDFVIGRQDSELLSARFTGSRFLKGTPYPTSLFHSVNLDMKAGRKLRLQEIVQIDERFVNFVLKNRRISVEGVTHEMLKLDQKKLVKVFSQADSSVASENPERAFSYFRKGETGKDEMGISFSVIHALGDHVEYEFAKLGKDDFIIKPGKEHLLK